MKKFVLLLIVTLALFGGIAAYASIPDSAGTINACYSNGASGTLRYLRAIDTSAGQTCRSDESSVSWNQAGANGVSGYEIVATNFTFSSGNSDQRAVFCPEGKRVIGGGFRHVSGAAPSDVNVITSGPVAGFPGGDTFGAPVNDRWAVRIQNDSESDLTASIFAICVLA